MATHFKTSFDESEAIRLLSGILESKRKIKTFFNENFQADIITTKLIYTSKLMMIRFLEIIAV